MRRFKYIEQAEGDCHQIIDVVMEVTEEEIIQHYYPRWIKLMEMAGRRGTHEDCIQDWIVENWAVEVKDDK